MITGRRVDLDTDRALYNQARVVADPRRRHYPFRREFNLYRREVATSKVRSGRSQAVPSSLNSLHFIGVHRDLHPITHQRELGTTSPHVTFFPQEPCCGAGAV